MVSVTTKKEWAVAYARAGLKVFPCFEIAANGRCSCYGKGNFCTPGKHPRTEHGLSDATDDIRQIERWWTQWPDANIGAAMAKSGLIGVDIDPRHGGDESWAQFRARHPNIPVTWTNLTGGGGEQLYFAVPPNFDHRGDSLPGYPGIDIKYNGYGILPPSNHQSGRAYAWEVGYSPFDFSVPAMIPPAIEDTITRKPGKDDTIPASNDDPVSELWTQPCPEGQRNRRLIRLLGWLQGDGVPMAHALGILYAWSQACCQPPLEAEYIEYQVKWAYGKWEAPAKPVLDDEGAVDVEATKASADFIDAVDYMDKPPPPWRIEGLLPDKVFSAVVGHPGSYKSFYVLDRALCIGTGTRFHGRWVKQGPVLYVLAEGAGAFGLRIRAWQKARKVKIPRGAVYILPNTVALNNQEAVLSLIQRVLAFQVPFAYIVFDTFSRSIAGADENLQKDMSAVVAAIGLIQRMLECGVEVVHHSNKGDGFRGSTVTPGALDAIVIIKKNDDGTVTVKCDKAKDVGEFPDTFMRPVVVDLADELPPPPDDEDEIVIRAEPASLVLEELSAEEQAERRTASANKNKPKTLKHGSWAWRFGEFLAAHFGKPGAREDQWRAAAAEAKVYDKDSPKERQAFIDAKRVLVNDGWVDVSNRNGSVSYHPSDALFTELAAWKR